jgi:uncharacterized protein (TIGR00106 family)
LILAEISIVPIGSGTSVSKFVRASLKPIEESGLKFTIGPMGTTIEANSLNEIFDIIGKAHKAVIDMGALRVITTIKIDDRKDKESSIERKLNSLK